MTEAIATQDYNGYTIEVTADLRFATCDRFFSTSHEAKAYIDDQRRAEAKATKLDHPVLTESGVAAQVKGFHFRHGGPLLDPKVDARYGGLYVDHPAVRERMARRDRLSREIKAINKSLDAFSVPTRVRSGPEQFGEDVGAFLKRYAEAFAAAEKAEPWAYYGEGGPA